TSSVSVFVHCPFELVRTIVSFPDVVHVTAIESPVPVAGVPPKTVHVLFSVASGLAPYFTAEPVHAVSGPSKSAIGFAVTTTNTVSSKSQEPRVIVTKYGALFTGVTLSCAL